MKLQSVLQHNAHYNALIRKKWKYHVIITLQFIAFRPIRCTCFQMFFITSIFYNVFHTFVIHTRCQSLLKTSIKNMEDIYQERYKNALRRKSGILNSSFSINKNKSVDNVDKILHMLSKLKKILFLKILNIKTWSFWYCWLRF